MIRGMPRNGLLSAAIPLVGILALGCGAARPRHSGEPVDVRLESIRPVPIRGAAASAEAVGEIGAIRITGYVLLPDRCHELAVDTAHASGATSILLFARDTLLPGRGCADMMHPVAFVAAVRGLDPGAHRLRVSYSPRQEQALPAPMLDRVVQVR